MPLFKYNKSFLLMLNCFRSLWLFFSVFYPSLLRFLRFLSISSKCSSSYHFAEAVKDSRYLVFKCVFITFNCPLTISGAWASSIILTHNIYFKGAASCSKGSRLVRTTVACGSNIVGSFDTAINSSSSATVPCSSDLYLSLSGS